MFLIALTTLGMQAMPLLTQAAEAPVPAATGAHPGAVSTLAPGPQRLLLHCGALVDVRNGRMLGAHTITVTRDRIEAVTPGAATPQSNDQVIDLGGQTCMPGWIDVHTHLSLRVDAGFYNDLLRLNPADHALRGVDAAGKTLRAGFTTVRNLGDVDNESLALRNAVTQGLVEGPRMFTAGRVLSATGGHGDPRNGVSEALMEAPLPEAGIINSADEAYRAVRQHYKEGADLIKVTVTGGVMSLGKNGDGPQLREDEIAAVVKAARDYGLKVAAHAHGTEGIRRALAAGVDSIEHGTQLDDATIATMKRQGTWYVPTLGVLDFIAERSATFPPVVRAKIQAANANGHASMERAQRAGLRIALGSDAGVLPHGENAREFTSLVGAGLSPMAALQAATVNAAALLGEDERLGTLEPGKFADVVAVSGDPTVDISLTRSPSFVMQGGRVVVAPPAQR